MRTEVLSSKLVVDYYSISENAPCVVWAAGVKMGEKGRGNMVI